MILENQIREKSAQCLHVFEALLYIIVGALLSAAAIGEVTQAGALLWRSAVNKAPTGYALAVLDQLLLVLMLVELLHTVRISVRSQSLIVEPFLIVGIMASIRRVLVITMQAAKMTEGGHSVDQQAFQNSMIELGVLAGLILVFVASIYVLRRLSRTGGAIRGEHETWTE